jgi:hypothetical protein
MLDSLAPEIAEVRRLRLCQRLDRNDEVRLTRRLVAQSSQRDVARALGVAQPTISVELKRFAHLAEVPEGFSGASPYEIAERFAAGQITREQLIDQLGRWQYRPLPPVAETDDLMMDTAGTWLEVEQANTDGLIDDAAYAAAFAARDVSANQAARRSTDV